MHTFFSFSSSFIFYAIRITSHIMLSGLMHYTFDRGGIKGGKDSSITSVLGNNAHDRDEYYMNLC